MTNAFQKPYIKYVLYRKRSTAAAGAGSIRVIKGKAACVQSILEIDQHTGEVQAVGLVHINFEAIDDMFLVAVLFLVEA